MYDTCDETCASRHSGPARLCGPLNRHQRAVPARKSYRRSISEYKKALRINPKSASIWSNLGMGYFARKDYKRADESWQQAMTLDPDVFDFRPLTRIETS